MNTLLMVGFGGFLGTVCRFVVYRWVERAFQNPFLLGTFGVNVIGSLLIGIILGLFVKGTIVSEEVKVILATGFCGGFTTFSAFSFESVQLIEQEQYGLFAAYTLGSIVLGVLMVMLGLYITR